MPTSAFQRCTMSTDVQDQIIPFIASQAQDFACGVLFRSGEVTKALWGGLAPPVSDAVDRGLAIAQAVGFCPAEADGDKIFGKPDSEFPFSGGQCAFGYNVSVVYTRVNGSSAITFSTAEGPIGGFRIEGDPNTSGAYVQIKCYGYAGNREPVSNWLNPSGGNAGGFQGSAASTITSVQITPRDGNTDNCGDLPGGGNGQISKPASEWPDPDPASQIKEYDIDVDFGELIGVKNVNLPFSNFKVNELFPMDFNFDVGGISFKYEDGDVTDDTSGSKEDYEEEEDSKKYEAVLDAILDVLGQIRDCTCEERAEFDTVYLARADCSETHVADVVLESIVALSGSVDAGLIARFNDSAYEAKECCERTKPLQNKNAEEIFSGVCTWENPVVFSPLIGLEVVSVVLEINSIEDSTLRYYKLAGSQSEAKLGHLGWTSEDFSANSSGPFCWSNETYYSLPFRSKEGRVRISLRYGSSFTLWDTGERLPARQIPSSALSSAQSVASLDNEV